MEFLESDICERIELSIERLGEIENEDFVLAKKDDRFVNIKDYFNKVAEFILYVYDVEKIIDYVQLPLETLKEINYKLYEDILEDNYYKSYANPDYAVAMLGEEYGKLLCFLYSEIRSIIAYSYEGKKLNCVATVELCVEIYSMFTQDETPDIKYIKVINLILGL